MLNILPLAIVTYLIIITFGYFLHKYFRLPWMFTVVLLGFVFSSANLFQDVIKGEIFQFLSVMGMLFFLFTIGVDLDFSKIKHLGKHIVIGNIALTLTEGFILALLFYFAFPQFVSHSFIVALSAGIAFGTVGEVLLLAILKEFKLETTKFGQLALGIGVFDDIFEIGILAVIVALPSLLHKGNNLGASNPLYIIVTLLAIFLVTFLFSKLGKLVKKIIVKLPDNLFVYPFAIFLIIFSFLYFSSLGNENLGVVAAIFSGVAVQLLFPQKIVEQYKKPIFFIGSIFLGPYFFLSLGSKISFESLLSYPLLIIAIIIISISVRVILSYFLFKNILGKKPSVVLGVGLCAKFSTSVVSENLLATFGLISAPLYSAIMASFILMKPIIIGVFSKGIVLVKKEIK